MTYGQLAIVVIPWNAYAIFIGEIASAESGWLFSKFAEQQSDETADDAGGWCIRKSLQAADKHWLGYLEGFCLIVSGILVAYVWSEYLAVPCLAMYARYKSWYENCWRSNIQRAGRHNSHQVPLLGTDGDNGNFAVNSASATLAVNVDTLMDESQSSMCTRRKFQSAPDGYLLQGRTTNTTIASTTTTTTTTTTSSTSSTSSSSSATTRKVLVCVLWSALNFCYTRFTKDSIDLLSCVKVKQGSLVSSVFVLDATIQCSTFGWQLPALLILLLLILGPLIPLCFLGDRAGTSFVRNLAATMNPFRSPCWFWRYLMPLHRLMLVLCANGLLIPGTTVLTSSIYVLVYCVFMLILTASFRPYSFRCTNFLEIFCNAFLLLIAIMHLPNSAWLSIGKFPASTDSSTSLFVQWRAMNTSLVSFIFFPLGAFVILIVPVSLRKWLTEQVAN